MSKLFLKVQSSREKRKHLQPTSFSTYSIVAASESSSATLPYFGGSYAKAFGSSGRHLYFVERPSPSHNRGGMWTFDVLSKRWEKRTSSLSYYNQTSFVDIGNYKLFSYGGAISGTAFRQYVIYDDLSRSATHHTHSLIGDACLNPIISKTNNGKVIVSAIGGFSSTPPRYTVIYDPVNNSLSRGANMPNGVFYAKGATIGEKLYVIGGNRGGGNGIANLMQIYDSDTNRWSVESLPFSAGQTNAICFSMGDYIYYSGGVSTNNPVNGFKLWQYSTLDRMWSSTLNLPVGFHQAYVCVYEDNAYIACERRMNRSDLTSSLDNSIYKISFS